MLKPVLVTAIKNHGGAATFGWLCVETDDVLKITQDLRQPPSGGCVLKQLTMRDIDLFAMQPPSGGCVLKHWLSLKVQELIQCSHLRVAVC